MNTATVALALSSAVAGALVSALAPVDSPRAEAANEVGVVTAHVRPVTRGRTHAGEQGRVSAVRWDVNPPSGSGEGATPRVRVWGNLSVVPDGPARLLLQAKTGARHEIALRADGSFDELLPAAGRAVFMLEAPSHRLGFYDGECKVRLRSPATHVGTIPVYRASDLRLQLLPEPDGAVYLRPFENRAPVESEWLTWPVLEGIRGPDGVVTFRGVQGAAVGWWLWTEDGWSHHQRQPLALARGKGPVHTVALERPGRLVVRLRAAPEVGATMRVVANPTWLGPATEAWLERKRYLSWLPVHEASRSQHAIRFTFGRLRAGEEWSVAVCAGGRTLADRTLRVDSGASLEWELALTARLLLEAPACPHDTCVEVRLRRQESLRTIRIAVDAPRAAMVPTDWLPAGSYELAVLPLEARCRHEHLESNRTIRNHDEAVQGRPFALPEGTTVLRLPCARCGIGIRVSGRASKDAVLPASRRRREEKKP